MPDPIMVASGRVSAAKRWKGHPGAPDLDEALSDLDEARLESAILKTLNAGRLDQGRRNRLAGLLLGSDLL